MNRSNSHLLVSGIEVLEGRIAPATILVGAPGKFNFETDYDEAPFVNTEADPLDSISHDVGPGGAGADTFYLKLKAGDKVQLYNGPNSFSDFIVVKSGTAVAFFVDDLTPGNLGINEVSATEFVGLSLGKGASVEVKGSVLGDVVTNLKDDGTLDMEAGAGGLVSSKQNIAGLVIGANVNGSVFSGGPVTNVDISGSVTEILAGTAANGKTFDFFPGVVGGDATLAVSAVLGEVGPGISKVKVHSVTGSIAAGAGGAGAKGGVIDTIEISQDTDGVSILGGKGGSFSGAKTSGGAGGEVMNVFISGVNDPSSNSPANGAGPAAYNIFAGNGGDGNATGTGGAGGKLSNVNVGYEKSGTATIASFNQIEDSVALHSGTGGIGKTAGAGGDILNSKVSVLTKEVAGNEIEIIAGDGGVTAAGAVGGAAGKGGSLSTLDVQNQDDNLHSDLELRAGSGGTAFGTATGAAGGSITGVTVLSAEVKALAGNGSDGKTGGVGGSVTSLTLIQRDSIVTNRLQLDAGFGGVGSGGAGGKGGDINKIKVDSGDFELFQINGGAAGNGGNGTGGKGGDGGFVAAVDVVDFDSGNGFNGAFTVRGGLGGDGSMGGGSGGKIDGVTLFGLNLEPTLSAGSGGKATDKGNGGAGGLVNNLNIFATGTVGGVNVSGVVTSGTGGAGLTPKNNGGAGGDVKLVNLSTDVNVTVTAGAGGDGGTQSAAGKGGSVITSAAFAATGFGILSAGNAGTAGFKAAAGGSILGGSASQLSALRAFTDLTVTAGNGSHGGVGGDIKGFAFGSPAVSLAPTPSGKILIQAGNGSAEGNTAGKGGSIDKLDGNPSFGADTQIFAGDGGGTATSTMSGAGGSVSNVSLFGVGDDFIGGNAVIITVEAGDGGFTGAAAGGLTPTAATGGAGGSVLAVGVNNLDPDAIFRSVASGDGASGIKKGGQGGLIDGVNVVGADIGYRQGQAYGYTSMGGVFAGVGGGGTVKGLSGIVRNVSAEAIASIVAGKALLAPELVEKVELISVGTVNGTDLLKYSEQDLVDDGPAGPGNDANYFAYNPASFATNNLVGAVVDPNRVDANKFAFADTNGNGLYDLGEVPTDGLVATKNLVTNSLNFIPEMQYALLINGKVLQTPVTETKNGAAAVKEIQEYSFNLSTGTYALAYKGVSTGFLPKGATAAEVETALDSLAVKGVAIIPGGVSVSATDTGTVRTFTITFNAFGNQMPIFLQPGPSFDYDNKL